MNATSLSPEMLAILRVLDSQGPLAVHQLYAQLYDPTAHKNRRAFASSLSRTIRRMLRRGLINREAGTVAITYQGRLILHPELREQMLAEAREIGMQAAEKAFSELKQSQAYQDLCKNLGIEPS